MSKQKSKKNNLQLAGIFMLVVLGLIFLSLLLRFLLVINESKFDGNHKFNVMFKGSNQSSIASFSPKPRSISIIKLPAKLENSQLSLEIPIDGTISTDGSVSTKQLSAILFKSIFPLGNKIEKLTFLDLIRLTLFARTVPNNYTYQREITDDLSKEQVNTILSLTFSDPTIYEENQTIEIINASNINGVGTKLALFITNLGGNPVLVTGSSKEELKSEIQYFGDKSYTVKRLSTYFNIPLVESKKRGIADVIIILGKDIVNHPNF